MEVRNNFRCINPNLWKNITNHLSYMDLKKLKKVNKFFSKIVIVDKKAFIIIDSLLCMNHNYFSKINLKQLKE